MESNETIDTGLDDRGPLIADFLLGTTAANRRLQQDRRIRRAGQYRTHGFAGQIRRNVFGLVLQRDRRQQAI